MTSQEPQPFRDRVTGHPTYDVRVTHGELAFIRLFTTFGTPHSISLASRER